MIVSAAAGVAEIDRSASRSGALPRVMAGAPESRRRAAAVRLALVLSIALFTGSTGRPSAAQVPDFVIGADVSFLPQVEAGGGWFEDSNGRRDALAIFRDHGFNLFRLRIWHRPAGGINGLEYNLALARRIRAVGGQILLDFHYSDTWADPGQQPKPAAWAALPFDVLADSVEAYTERVLRAFDAAGALPVAVQIGNETTSGVLWNDGRVGGSYDNDAQWQKLRTLLSRGITAVRRVQRADSPIKVVLHIDRGGSWSGTQWWFDRIGTTVDYDWIGLSYYPWWHGTLSAFQYNLSQASRRYGKGILIAETAYPWSTGWFDNTNNIVGSGSTLAPGYPATPTGQRDFLRFLSTMLKQQANAVGWVYWAPDWTAAPRFGSAWENVALFDHTWRWMHEATLTGVEGQGDEAPSGGDSVMEIWPVPAGDRVTVDCRATEAAGRQGPNDLRGVVVYDVLGRLVAREVVESGHAVFDTSAWVTGPYFARCDGNAGRARGFTIVR